MAKTVTTFEDAIRVLIAPKDDAEAAVITAELDRAESPADIRRASTRNEFLQFIELFGPQVVVGDYDFGHFPFINEVREKHPEIPFVILSELELVQNAPRRGLNIYILKSELSRLSKWIDTLSVTGLFKQICGDNASQVDHFLKATETSFSGRKATHKDELRLLEGTQIGFEEKTNADSLNKWTEEIEHRMSSAAAKPKDNPSRPDSFLTI